MISASGIWRLGIVIVPVPTVIREATSERSDILHSGVETDATCLTCHNLQDSMNEIPVCFLAKKKCTFLLMRTFIREKYVQVKSRLSSRWPTFILIFQ